MKKISEVMTADVKLARPEQSIREAALVMAAADVFSLSEVPVPL